MLFKPTPTSVLTTLVAAAAIGFSTTNVKAEDSIQTGDGLLTLSASLPDEIRAGQSFTYEVKVTNASDNVVLHDIQLRQRETKGFTVESVATTGNNQAKQDQSKKAMEEKKSNANKSMKISTLKPGESRTLKVTAAADEEGELKSCLEIASYTPALCLISKVVKPQLELTKVAPQKADRCSVIELQYAVKNGGSGDVGPFTVTDSLGDGLATIEGDTELKFDVDGLKAGDTRKFVARVYAQKPGEFSSRAEAKAENSKLNARSKQTTTKVSAADLAASIEGPRRLYGDQIARFTAKITNTGNADAENVRVRVLWAGDSNLVDLGEPEMARNQGSAAKKQGEKKQKGEPTPVKKDSKPADQQNADNKDSEKSSVGMDEETLTIDRLAAGQTATIEYAVRAGDVERLPTKVIATYVCSVDAAEDQAQARTEATSMAMAEVKIVRLPAMQLLVVDDEDPVSNGAEVRYMIRVWNEGDAPDNNVQLVAKLPEGLSFQSAEGPTKHNNDGATVTFEPIESMKAGERADYLVIAKSEGEGNVRFEAKLSSEKLSEAVSTQEPTRLFKRQQQQ